MTELGKKRPLSKLQRSRRATTSVLFIFALGLSVAFFGALSWQMAQGSDPVIGSGTPLSAPPPDNSSAPWSAASSAPAVPAPEPVVSQPS